MIFLMALLRIADFLQIQAARAPTIFNQIHRIISPFSENEWRVHQSITNITTSIPDPKAIFVSAVPKSVKAFLRLSGWMKDLQSELDTSWAVLGEVYGRFEKERLSDLKLALRRITSNFEDTVSFRKTVPYVPERIRFTVAEPELLSLLIAPLYGDNPLYGLRELTQNSADAVLELKHLTNSGLAYDTKDQIKECDIEVVLNESANTFVIQDNGAGMTLEIIKDYFLKAGASFRFSDAWIRRHADEIGKSKIARAGRFGVGALSSFLIGDEITIYTRHYSDTLGRGNQFSCAIDDESIEIVRAEGPVGTRITIKTSPDRLKRVIGYVKGTFNTPFFYYLPGNVVIRFVLHEKDMTTFTLAKSDLQKPEWREVLGTSYERVERRKISDQNYIVYDDGVERHWAQPDGRAYCNDILVGDFARNETRSYPLGREHDGVFEFRHPTVSIVDNNGRLPLDLSRRGFAREDADLNAALKRSMTEEFISTVFLCPAQSPSKMAQLMEDKQDLLHNNHWNRYALSGQGYTILDLGIISQGAERIITCESELGGSASVFARLKASEGIVCGTSQRVFPITNKKEIIRHLRYGEFYWPFMPNYWDALSGPHWKGYHAVEEKSVKELLGYRSLPRYQDALIKNAPVFSHRGASYIIFMSHEISDSNEISTFRSVLKSAISANVPERAKRAISMWVPLKDPIKNDNDSRYYKSLIAKIWNECFSSAFLPYKKEDRAKMLKRDSPIRKFI